MTLGHLQVDYQRKPRRMTVEKPIRMIM
jgi:hypothetical protein